jgi:TPR repeat protein
MVAVSLESIKCFGLALVMGSLSMQPAIAQVTAGIDAYNRGDFSTAIKLWREQALKGDADAQFNLGQAYKMGRGVKVDLDIALDWYRRAANQGHLKASDSLGHVLHYQGKIPEALPYLKPSAERGDPRSQYLFATELFNGVYIAKDWVRAYAFMTSASSSGMTLASRSLVQMDQYIPLEQRQKGVVMAGQIQANANNARSEQIAGFPINTAPPSATGRPVDIPPSYPTTRPAPGFPGVVTPAGGVVQSPSRPAIRSAPAAAPRPASVRPTATDSGWRIQLGAFGNEASARRLWTQLEGKVSDLRTLQPYLTAAGKITRLQAGPFASRSAAEAMCGKLKAAGQACLVMSK